MTHIKISQLSRSKTVYHIFASLNGCFLYNKVSEWRWRCLIGQFFTIEGLEPPTKKKRKGGGLVALTHSHTMTPFDAPGKQPFENTVGKGEIARNEQFLLYPQCFLPV